MDSKLNFKQKLDALENDEHLGSAEKELLAVLSDAGSAAAHRGWKPSDDHLHTMITTIEYFLHRCFVANVKVAELKTAIPQRPPKP